MKRWSITLKLTVLYAFFMTMITCVALAILFSLSNKEVLSSVQNALKNQVQEGVQEIEFSDEDGGMEVDSDFYDLEDGVYLSLYGADGTFLYGRMPRGFAEQLPFQNDTLRTISGNQEKWYVFDLAYSGTADGKEGDSGSAFYVRGIASVTAAEQSLRVTTHFALILLPLLVVVTVIVGYQFTKRAFRPVKQMTETVQEIQKDTDLSRRIGLVGGRDEIHHLAATFDKMLDRLETSFHRERQFTSDVSHELRTPVAVMLLQCEELLKSDSLSQEEIRQVQVIQKKAKEMSGMISQLLLLSRADQGRMHLQMEYLNLSELTEMIVEEQEYLAEEQGIQVTGEIEPNINGWADESFFIRMAGNLISNAVFYGKESGWVKVRLKKETEMVCLEVEDNGIGIAREDLPHIWERFYRADGARSGSGHSGLGLSMVQWIAKAHHGEVEVESEEGKGSLFRVKIPLERREG